MVQSIILSAINLNRLKLGETLVLVRLFRKLEHHYTIKFDFEKVMEVMSNYTYVYSFTNIESMTNDIIQRCCDKKIKLEYVGHYSEEMLKFYNYVENAILSQKIDFEMFEFLNLRLWPTLVEFVFNNLGNLDDDIMEVIISIPCDEIYEYYSKYVVDAKNINTLSSKTQMTYNATVDVLTWLISNRIAYPKKEDITLENGSIKFYIKFRI